MLEQRALRCQQAARQALLVVLDGGRPRAVFSAFSSSPATGKFDRRSIMPFAWRRTRQEHARWERMFRVS